MSEDDLQWEIDRVRRLVARDLQDLRDYVHTEVDDLRDKQRELWGVIASIRKEHNGLAQDVRGISARADNGLGEVRRQLNLLGQLLEEIGRRLPGKGGP